MTATAIIISFVITFTNAIEQKQAGINQTYEQRIGVLEEQVKKSIEDRAEIRSNHSSILEKFVEVETQFKWKDELQSTVNAYQDREIQELKNGKNTNKK